jgi:hypothetical protein
MRISMFHFFCGKHFENSLMLLWTELSLSPPPPHSPPLITVFLYLPVFQIHLYNTSGKLWTHSKSVSVFIQLLWSVDSRRSGSLRQWGGCRMRMRKSKGIQRFCMHKFALPRKVLRNRVLLLKIISVSGKYTYYLSAHKPLFLLFQGPNSAQLNKGEIRASYFSATGC